VTDEIDDSEPQAEEREPTLSALRALAPLGSRLGEIASGLVKQGALGLLLIDATPLLAIEKLHGARAFRSSIDALAEGVRSRVEGAIGEEMLLASGALEEEHLLVFMPRLRDDAEFFLHDLPRVSAELRAWASQGLKRVVYPYLNRVPELAVGAGFVLHRPFQRPEAQLRHLIDRTLEDARFEHERSRRQRGGMLEKILLEQTVTTVFEPIVALASNAVLGYEALSRGPSGTGLETPMALFGTAELFDREYELDSLCRRRALSNARGIASDQLLFLNILPTCIQDPDFQAAHVRETLAELGLGPRNLVLEISERQAISNFPIFREAIDQFSGLGFRIALDDTGSGFSSLEAALELQPDFLKIDMSLVRSIEDSPEKQEVLRGLQSLSAKMGSQVIAEGIETAQELAVIRSLGIEFGQGFYLGRGGATPSGTPRPLTPGTPR
jgi:EAL domain-containing protein (putative c-di-GMP-specific phosphodiesterase class I)